MIQHDGNNAHWRISSMTEWGINCAHTHAYVSQYTVKNWFFSAIKYIMLRYKEAMTSHGVRMWTLVPPIHTLPHVQHFTVTPQYSANTYFTTRTALYCDTIIFRQYTPYHTYSTLLWLHNILPIYTLPYVQHFTVTPQYSANTHFTIRTALYCDSTILRQYALYHTYSTLLWLHNIPPVHTLPYVQYFTMAPQYSANTHFTIRTALYCDSTIFRQNFTIFRQYSTIVRQYSTIFRQYTLYHTYSISLWLHNIDTCAKLTWTLVTATLKALTSQIAYITTFSKLKPYCFGTLAIIHGKKGLKIFE